MQDRQSEDKDPNEYRLFLKRKVWRVTHTLTPTDQEMRLLRSWCRTSRRASCNGCGNSIEPNEFRLLLHPNPADVVDLRQRGKVWWVYSHCHRDCLRQLQWPATFDMPSAIANLTVDCAPLAKKAKETPEAYRASVDDARRQLEIELASL